MFPISMRQLSHLLTLLFVLFHLNGKAQIDIQEDERVDPLLKHVAAKRPGLTMFGRKDGEKYMNMAVLTDSTRTLTWFTCYGQAFDVTRLTDDDYSRIKSGSLDPFTFYKDYFFGLLSVVRDAAAQFRQKGEAVLKDTDNIYYRVYSYPPIQQARSMLQKEVAMERIMSDLYLKRALFDNPTPQKLLPNDSFQLRLKMAGRMIQKGDTTSYYNTNPLSSAARIMLCKQAPGKMFVYDRQGQLADSVPLKAGKYTALLNEKEDVFLLYRGWLELQSQQAIAGKEEVAKLLNREYTMMYKPVYWAQHKQQLQRTLSEVQEQVDAASGKVMGLILPDPKETVHLLASVYQEKPAEISYISGIGFAYSVVYFRGNKRYELADHRGNVMAVVSDKKKGIDENGDGAIEYYNADVVNAVDYFPFGSQMPGRTYSDEDKYRYGFNGKENDNEVKGEGNQQDYGMRIYDPRIGRFLSADPLTRNFAYYSPYQFAGNKPIMFIDLDGAEVQIPFINQFKYGDNVPLNAVNVVNNGGVNLLNGGIGVVNSLLFVGYNSLNPSKLGREFKSEVQELSNNVSQTVAYTYAYHTQTPWRQQFKDAGHQLISAEQWEVASTFTIGMAAGKFELPSLKLSSIESSEAFALNRRGSNTGSFADLEVPMQLREVKKVADQAGIGLKGVKLRIVREPDFLSRPLFGLVDKKSITLYPNAFRNYESLVKTLGHERTHVYQISIWGRATNTEMLGTFEEATYGIENTFWDFYKSNQSVKKTR